MFKQAAVLDTVYVKSTDRRAIVALVIDDQTNVVFFILKSVQTLVKFFQLCFSVS